MKRPFNGKALGEQIVSFVRSFVAKHVDALKERIDGIEAAVKAIPAGPKGDPGDPGRVDVDWFVELVRAEVTARISEIPRPKDGEPGKDADMGAVKAMIDDAVLVAVSALPPPVPGKDADPDLIKAMVREAVEAIPPAPAGKDADVDFMLRSIDDAVAKAIADIPRPENGKDADPTVIAELVSKSVAEIVASLPKPEKGDPGKDADPDVVRGIVQELIDKAIAALPEPQPVEPIHEDTIARIAFDAAQKAIATIPPPRDGLDALQINIHPMMEEGKSYPSGVYIRHKGGLIRTTTTGYDVIINGVDNEAEVTLEDGRTIERTTTYTDGTTFVRRHKFATLMHRGTWTQKTYDRGDCVMRDNSSWCCMAESTETMPGTSKDWQLIARKGDRGKDANTPKPPSNPVRI